MVAVSFTSSPVEAHLLRCTWPSGNKNSSEHSQHLALRDSDRQAHRSQLQQVVESVLANKEPAGDLSCQFVVAKQCGG